MILDYLLRFNYETDAISTKQLAGYLIQCSINNSVTWHDYCLTDLSVYEDDNGEITEYPGWWMMISLRERNNDLRDIPGNVCRAIFDRELALASDPNYIIYTAPNLSQSFFTNLRIEPLFPDAGYPFGI